MGPLLEEVRRVMVAPAHPESMQYDCELARDRHHGALLGNLAPACGDGLAMPPEITRGTERAEDVVGRGDEQAAPQRILNMAAGLATKTSWPNVASSCATHGECVIRNVTIHTGVSEPFVGK